MVSEADQKKLSEAIHSTPGFRQTSYMADCIAERVVELGWTPPATAENIAENMASNQVAVREIDMMDRIISGLPVGPVYDVASLYPQEVNLDELAKSGEYHIRNIPTLEEAANTWVPVPNFRDYEINTLGEVRSKWTKRVLDYEPDVIGKYVEMHDKDGHPQMVSVNSLVSAIFD